MTATAASPQGSATFANRHRQSTSSSPARGLHNDGLLRTEEMFRRQLEQDLQGGRCMNADGVNPVDSSENVAHAGGRASSSSSSSPVGGSNAAAIRIQVHPWIFDCLDMIREWTQGALTLWWELLCTPPLSRNALHMVSIFLLVLDKWRTSSFWQEMMVAVLGRPEEGKEWSLSTVVESFVWAVPCFATFLSVAFVITLQLTCQQQGEAVIVTGVISLIVLEAILPIFVLVCTSLFLFQQVSWEVGSALLLVVWCGSSFCSQCIRRMLYQNMGHG